MDLDMDLAEDSADSVMVNIFEFDKYYWVLCLTGIFNFYSSQKATFLRSKIKPCFMHRFTSNIVRVNILIPDIRNPDTSE